MASAKKPLPAFEVLFDGKGIYPEAIPLGALTQALSAIRRLAAGAAVAEEDEEDEEETGTDDDGSIRLIKVKRGSAVYQFTTPPTGSDLANLRQAGKVLDSPDNLGENDYVLRPIEIISAVAKRLNCAVVVREVGAAGKIMARIEPKSYEQIAGSLFVSGETSLTGSVLRVGGATGNRCALRVPFQTRMLYCHVANEDVARQLGQRLYEPVAVTGKAQWLRAKWKVVTFTIHDVYQPKSGPILEAFHALWEAGGKGWDGVADPKQVLNEISGQ